jgi:hypothetical protein
MTAHHARGGFWMTNHIVNPVLFAVPDSFEVDRKAVLKRNIERDASTPPPVAMSCLTRMEQSLGGAHGAEVGGLGDPVFTGVC